MNFVINPNKMSAEIYWNLLVLFSVLYQGIIGTLADKEIDESSEDLVRQKRVINRAPGGEIREQIRDVPYIVCVKQLRRSAFCAGVILKPSIVLTAFHCIPHNDLLSRFRVYSGSSTTSAMIRHGVVRNVTNQRKFLGNFPYRPADGIALLTVVPSFRYSINTRNIEFYQGHIQPGSLGMVSGWGCNPTGHSGTTDTQILRSIAVPIISNEECGAIYRQTHFPVSANDICTWDRRGLQYCSANDAGAPLVIEENNHEYLVGIHIHNVAVSGRILPDVFANLQTPAYKSWILENIHSIEGSLH